MAYGLLARAALAALPLALAAAGAHAQVDALNADFHQTYEAARTHLFAAQRASVPLLVNRFDQIALYRPGIGQPEIFTVDQTAFNQARSVSHGASALYLRLAPFGLGPLDAARLDWLAGFERRLSAAEADIAGQASLPAEQRSAQLGLLAEVRRFTQRIRQRGEIDQPLLDEYRDAVRPGISENFRIAAAAQLEQFRAQIDRWRQAYPSLAWDRALGLIISTHQPRRLYLQRQFLDWLLRDDPEREDRVVFAETMTIPPPLEQGVPPEAMRLLSAVMLDKALAEGVLGDSLALQTDALGPAAQEIIRGWPTP